MKQILSMDKILLSYKKRNILIGTPSSLNEFKKEAYAKFSLDSAIPLIIQCFNKSWSEYIDVTRDDEIITGCKYRIILELPQVLYVENSDILTQNRDLIQSSNTSFSSEVYDSNALSRSSTSAESNSTLNLFSTAKFSVLLSDALNAKLPLGRALKSELIHLVCRAITVDSKYPSSIIITDAARKIVADYPYLKESIGTGYGGWRQSIRDCLKNMRRCDQSEEVKARKKLIKAAPNIEKAETSLANNNQPIDNSPSHLRETFDLRRHEIVVQKVKIEGSKGIKIEVLKGYPSVL